MDINVLNKTAQDFLYGYKQEATRAKPTAYSLSPLPPLTPSQKECSRNSTACIMISLNKSHYTAFLFGQ